jgi:general secretion pathway protein J
LLFGGLSFGTRVWEKTQVSATDTNRVRAAQLFLTNEIAQIYPFFAGDQSTDKHVDFSGEDQRMTFFAPSKNIPGAMDLVTIQALRGKNGVSVVVASHNELEGSRGPIAHHTVLSGLKWFQISYYGSPAAAATTPTQPSLAKAGLGANQALAPPPPQWTSVWIGQRALPALIRIRAAFTDRTEWPDLVVSPRTDVDEGCVLDELTKYCQGR